MYKPLIFGLGGAPFPDSSSERALRVSLAAAAAVGTDTAIMAGPDLNFPMYNPRSSKRDAAQAALVDHLRRCEGLIIASPSYHGSVSGWVKNALDYIEDLRSDGRVYLDGVAIGLIVCAGGDQGGSAALAALRSIAHAVRGWPTPLGALLNTARPLFDAEGRCTDAAARGQLTILGQQVANHAFMRRAQSGGIAPRQNIAGSGG